MTDPTTTAREVEHFAAYLDAFVEKVNERSRMYFAAEFPMLKPPTHRIDPRGKKYVRIVRYDESGGRSVYCFIEKSTGNILMAAGWRGPAKHSRGNIYAKHPLAGTTPYGAAYLR